MVDVNGDGNVDFVVEHDVTGSLQTVRGRGEGRFDAGETVYQGLGRSHFVEADFNQYQVNDVAIYSGNPITGDSPTLVIYAGNDICRQCQCGGTAQLLSAIVKS